MNTMSSDSMDGGFLPSESIAPEKSEYLQASTLSALSVILRPMNRDHAFEIVKTARNVLDQEDEVRKSRKDTPPSLNTLRDYEKKCNRIDDEIQALHDPWGVALQFVMGHHARRKKTFLAIRSALKQRGLERVRDLLTKQDVLQRVQPESVTWYEAVRELDAATGELQLVRSLNREECLQLVQREPLPSLSKKGTLKYLKPGWQDRFLDANQTSPEYRMAGALLRFCGLRPVELKHGVTLKHADEGVVVHIIGGKVRETAGQPWRSFLLVRDRLPEWFVREVKTEGSLVVKVDPDALRTHLHRMSYCLKPSGDRAGKKKVSLSAYLFRHSLVTELRGAGWKTEEIAGVIGESAAETVRLYGRRVRVRSKTPMAAIEKTSVQTARPVKPVETSGLDAVLRKTRGLAGPGPR